MTRALASLLCLTLIASLGAAQDSPHGELEVLSARPD